MPLATLDRSPPPFFKQGPSAFTRLMFFSALAIFLMVADGRWKMTLPLRAAVATVLNPAQQVLLAPARAWEQLTHYFSGMDEARAVQQRAQRMVTSQAERVMRMDELARENARLRGLLDLRPRIEVATSSAEILYDTQDPFTRKVVIDRGESQGVVLGSPVVDETGVLGQVTRVYPLTSEVTLVTDKDAAVPVVNVRTQQRGVSTMRAKAESARRSTVLTLATGKPTGYTPSSPEVCSTSPTCTSALPAMKRSSMPRACGVP